MLKIFNLNGFSIFRIFEMWSIEEVAEIRILETVHFLNEDGMQIWKAQTIYENRYQCRKFIL